MKKTHSYRGDSITSVLNRISLFDEIGMTAGEAKLPTAMMINGKT